MQVIFSLNSFRCVTKICSVIHFITRYTSDGLHSQTNKKKLGKEYQVDHNNIDIASMTII